MPFELTVTVQVDTFDEADSAALSIATAMELRGIACRVSEARQVSETRVEVFTDGGCDARTRLGAWGFLIRKAGVNMYGNSQALVDTTNNRMEMMAVIKALEQLPASSAVLITTDSEYVMKGATIWAPNWKRRGWMTSNQKPVLNKDLWERLLELIPLFREVAWKHVRGHTGHPENEAVDQMCTEAMKLAKLDIKDGNPVPYDVVGQ